MTLEQKMREFAAKYPTPASHPSGGDGNWDQDCGRVMFRFGSFIGWNQAPTKDISSARIAASNSNIESKDVQAAPIGAYHFWDIGGWANGHVAQQADTNTLVFMGSAKVWEDLGKGIGFASVQDYLNKTPGATYLGWSLDYAGGRPNLAAFAGLEQTPVVDFAFGLSTNAQSALQGALSILTRPDGAFYYTAKIDGIFGQISVAALQQFLKDRGLLSATYDVDGKPGPTYARALQTLLASEAEYTGDIDGAPAGLTSAAAERWGAEVIERAKPPVDWAKWQAFLTIYAGYTGPVNGVADKPTYLALQGWLKAHFGYTGFVDGDPGDLTWAAFARAVAAGYPTTVAAPPPVVVPPTAPVATLPILPARLGGHLLLVDCGTTQANFDFGAFGTAGGDGSILKAGGGNASDSPYVAPRYLTQEARQRLVGNFIDGHYWFNGRKNGLTPTTSARFYAANIRLVEGDLIGLDVEDETDTDTTAYTPAEAREFIEEFVVHKPGAKFLLYMSSSLARSQDWTWFYANGHGLWVAQWGVNDGTIPSSDPSIGAWPEWVGWQFASNGVIPGAAKDAAGNFIRTDINVFRPDVVARFGYKVPVVIEEPDPDPEPEAPTELVARVFAIEATLERAAAAFTELAAILKGNPK